MIFIGGIGPKKKQLDSQPRICPSCGLAQAYLVRFDDYLSLFFIPILRIRRGRPLVQCQRCGHVTDESGQVLGPSIDLSLRRCAACGAILERDFSYCPYCGQSC